VLLYEATTRAFFGISAPEGTEAGERLGTGILEGIVRFADLVPTFFDLADLELAASVEGHSLLGERSEVAGAYGETYYPLLHYGWSPLLSWRDERWSYVNSPDPELFDRWRDPGETQNVLEEHPEVAERMAERITPLVREPEEPQSESIPTEVREKLAALGYLAGEAPQQVDRRKNPRDLIGAVAAMYRGMTLRATGNYDGALSYFQRAYSIDPDNAENVFQLANCLRLMGDRPSAMEYYRQAIEMRPEGGMAHAHLAMLELETGQTERAWRTLEEGLSRAPRNHALLMTAGDMHFDKGALEQAERYYLEARGHEPRSIDPWIRLAQLATARGREKEARAAWERAFELEPTNPAIPEQVRRTLAKR
jgi:tetratricopeptide (TPR) repeat protein